LGGKKGIQPVKKLNGEVLVWLSVWSEVQMIAYGPADATVTPSSLAPGKSRMVYLSGAGLPGLWWKKGCYMDVVVVVIVVVYQATNILNAAGIPPHHYNRLQPFFRYHQGEPVAEENFRTLWCKGRLTEADTATIRLGATHPD